MVPLVLFYHQGRGKTAILTLLLSPLGILPTGLSEAGSMHRLCLLIHEGRGWEKGFVRGAFLWRYLAVPFIYGKRAPLIDALVSTFIKHRLKGKTCHCLDPVWGFGLRAWISDPKLFDLYLCCLREFKLVDLCRKVQKSLLCWGLKSLSFSLKWGKNTGSWTILISACSGEDSP